MVLEFFRRRGDRDLADIDAQIEQMLEDGRFCFDSAVKALFGEADPQAVGPEIHNVDRRINATERQVRRQLVVHTSVHRAGADVPLVLAYMTIIKDIERIGDYAKNIWDLAAHGVNMANDEDQPFLAGHHERVSRMITEASRAFVERDVEESQRLAEEGDGLLDVYDDQVHQLVASDMPSHHGVPRALLLRYYKRITAHLLNVLSAVLMPLDRIDYYDENRRDRE